MRTAETIEINAKQMDEVALHAYFERQAEFLVKRALLAWREERCVFPLDIKITLQKLDEKTSFDLLCVAETPGNGQDAATPPG